MTLPQAENTDLVCYRYDQIRDIWPEIAGHLKLAIDRGSNYTLVDLYKGLRRKRMQLWTSQRGGCIEASLVTLLQDNYCLLLAAGGKNMRVWRGFLPIVEQWAREHGATEMRIYGRRGWIRALPGFKEVYTKAVKPL